MRVKKVGVLLAVSAMTLCLLSGCSMEKKEKNKNAGDVAAKEVKKATENARKSKMAAHQKLWLGEVTDPAAVLRKEAKEIQVKCADESVAVVLKNGSLHGVQPGKTKISVIADGKTYHCTVTVRKRGMVYPSFSMMKDEHLDLQFSSGQKAADYQWRSLNPAVAKVSSKGRITAGKVGKTVITGSLGQKQYRCKLTVTKKMKNVVYLTFDDGPNRYSTPKILKILKKNNVKATFFELRPARKDYDLTERVLAEGHTLALHGYQHKYDQVYKSKQVYHDNLDKLRNLFFKKYGVWCTLSRFPGGSSNTASRYTPGIMTKLTKKLDGWGYHYFDWNVSSGDAGGAVKSSEVYRNVTRGLIKGRGNVVLMHDFNKNDKTIHALDKIIKYGKKHGYTFLPLTASTEEVHHAVFN